MEKKRFQPFIIRLNTNISCYSGKAKNYINRHYDVIAMDNSYYMINVGINGIWESLPPVLASPKNWSEMLELVLDIERYVGVAKYYFINKTAAKIICQDCCEDLFG